MNKTVGLLTVILFIVWLIPLGFFIKPGQEKNVCNGQRAFCMCQHSLSSTAPLDGFTFKGGLSHQHEVSLAGGNIQGFLGVLFLEPPLLRVAHLFPRHIFCYKNPDVDLFEHIPKV